MSFDGLLIHTAYVRSVDRQEDPLGQVVEHELDERAVRCRLDRPSGGEKSTDSMSDTLFLQYKLFFDGDAALVEGDHINRIEDANGETIATDIDILHIQRQDGLQSKHHYEVIGQAFVETGVV